MSCIKIVKVPPGKAPPNIREQWLNIEITLTEQKESGGLIAVDGSSPDPANEDGYDVSLEAAIHSLKVAGRHQAARYWQENVFAQVGGTLRFGKEFCEYIA